MERNFYNDDFEELLKEKADQYKMYPSDKVWNGIQNSLHSRRKWYWIGFALLLSGVSYYTVEALLAPPAPKRQATAKISEVIPAEQPPLISGEEAPSDAIVIPLTPDRKSYSNKPEVSATAFRGVFNIDRSYQSPGPASALATIDPAASGSLDAIMQQAINNREKQSSAEPGTAFITGVPVAQLADTYNEEENNIETPGAKPGTAVRFPMESEPSAEDASKINWLQEFALYQLTIPKTKRLGWQLAFSPTMNYRKLSASRNSTGQHFIKNIPMSMNFDRDIDELLSHKPALGFELGSHLRYRINRTVTFKTGIQFNYSRYAIEAFNSPTADIATIALNSVGGLRRDSVSAVSTISNFGGNSVKEIQNQYFQLSAPIGLEIKIIDGKRLQFHVAGTVQPTYLINRNSYLITSDYQNYMREPSLVRRWNVNTSAEAFVSYSTGGISWQVGPQFRYQLLSSYISAYPIRENLMEYGIKIGVTKTLR